jgi:hypothetical protein
MVFFQVLTNDLSLKYTNLTVEPYGELSADQGLPIHGTSQCPGTGVSGTEGSSGAGHGGSGGQGQGQIRVGVGHDSYLDPKAFGCEGGNSRFPYLGGKGGGRLHVSVSDWLTIDGEISAEGGDWRSIQAGGGSGGAVFINARTVDGSGVIDVSGGQGYGGTHTSHGGGGAGGRIAFYYVNNYYVGQYENFFYDTHFIHFFHALASHCI